MSLWGATVITNLLSAIPWIGKDFVEFFLNNFLLNLNLNFVLGIYILYIVLIYLQCLASQL